MTTINYSFNIELMTKKPKIALIGTVGVPGKYGGFETLAHQLVENLTGEVDFTVYSSTHAYPKQDRVKNWKGARIKYIPLNANGAQSIFYDIWSILNALLFADVLLIMGVSGCIILPFLRLFSKRTVIVNIDGLEWRRDKWKAYAKRFLQFSEMCALKYADEIITDNKALQDYVIDRYGRNTQLIEYGADHALSCKAETEHVEKYPFLEGEYGFKVSRIEPENNVDMILNVYANLPNRILVYVGNWDYSPYGRSIKEKFNAYQNIILLDPIYDSLELGVLRSNATYYVHGHSAGGTNPSLVEAMYLGLPIMAFDCSFNRVTTENRAVFFENEEELEMVIDNLSNLPLERIGKNMKTIADNRYTWSIIANKYYRLTALRESIPAAKPSIAGLSIDYTQQLQRIQSANVVFMQNYRYKTAEKKTGT